jgi:predicted dehydrogenase
MKEIRVGIIGTGGMAGGHVNNFRKEPDVRLVACCDVRPDVAKAFAARHSIPAVYADYKKMLDKEQLDAITVVTSDKAHCPVSVAALKRGLHVLCEKPMATSLAEAKEMYRTAKAAKKMNMIQFSYRPIVALERARELIAQGTLGKIKHVEASYLQSWLLQPAWGDWRESYGFLWRLSRKHGGGTLADIGCHILDFTTYAAGDIAKLSCTMKSFDKGVPRNRHKGYTLDADDGFFATAEFASGAIGVIHATRWATGHMNALRLRIFGDKGALVIDTEQARDKMQVCVGEFAQHYALWSTLPVGISETSVYARFIRSIRTGKRESPTFLDGLKIQTYLDACKKSAKTGRTVAVKV